MPKSVSFGADRCLACTRRRAHYGTSWGWQLAPSAAAQVARDVRVAPTNDRSIVGVMNEFAFHGEFHWKDGMHDFEALSVRMAGMPLGPLRQRNGSPDRELAAVLGSDSSYTYDFGESTVATRLRRAGVDPTWGVIEWIDIERAKRLYASGLSLLKVGAGLGVSAEP